MMRRTLRPSRRRLIACGDGCRIRAERRRRSHRTATPPEQMRTCADFQALIPDYLQSYVSGPRALLLEDHMSECIHVGRRQSAQNSARRG
jgi:hypothetical protein